MNRFFYDRNATSRDDIFKKWDIVCEENNIDHRGDIWEDVIARIDKNNPAYDELVEINDEYEVFENG